MNQEKIDRINFLARKSRECGLTDEERAEQIALRQEYVSAFRQSLTSQLDNTWIVDENGKRRKLERRPIVAQRHTAQPEPLKGKGEKTEKKPVD